MSQELLTCTATDSCEMGTCQLAPNINLHGQTFCVNHFLLRCYAVLEVVDPRCRKFSIEPVDLSTMRDAIEECSRKALEVSMRSETLDNLQRGRLLDILLWAGDLYLLLRVPRYSLGQPITPTSGRLAKRSVPPSH